VLVAMVLVALGMMAVFNEMNQATFASTYLRNKTLASWVAMNRISQLSLSGAWLEPGRDDGDEDFAGQHFRWRQTVSNTEVPDLRRVDVTVSFADSADQPLATLTGFLSPPAATGASAGGWGPQDYTPGQLQ
jgi:general secretion pathway protein I